MRETLRVACIQAEPVILDRERTLDKQAALATEAARAGARLLVFPEAFLPAYPSSAWAKFEVSESSSENSPQTAAKLERDCHRAAA